MSQMTIGKLAKATGVGVETIRFYEREGLIRRPPRQIGAGYRKYEPEVIHRLSFIRRAKELGFSLTDIKDLLNLRANTKAKCSSVKEKAKTKIDDVDKKISDLQSIKAALEQLVSVCNAEAPTSECPILDAMNQQTGWPPKTSPCCQ